MSDLERESELDEEETGGRMGDVGGLDDEDEIPGVGTGDETIEDDETLSDDEL
jgi:hypothetical protein